MAFLLLSHRTEQVLSNNPVVLEIYYLYSALGTERKASIL